MKTKKLSKKLTLRKTTITNLDHKEQSQVKGGYWPTVIGDSCHTWHPNCYTQPRELCPFTLDCSEYDCF